MHVSDTAHTYIDKKLLKKKGEHHPISSKRYQVQLEDYKIDNRNSK
jgi:hypothetical protein